MKYTATFLDDAEFDALPYRDMESKVGVADPEKGVAYARKTGIPVLDAFNILHEIEHLEEGHEGEYADHYDPEYGVYYKGFGNMFSGIGNAFSNIGGGISRAAGGISRGVGSIFGGGQHTVPEGSLTRPVGQGGIVLHGSNAAKGGYSSQPWAMPGGPLSTPATMMPPGGSAIQKITPLMKAGPAPFSNQQNQRNLLDQFFPAAGKAISSMIPPFDPSKQSRIMPGGGTPKPPQPPQSAMPSNNTFDYVGQSDFGMSGSNGNMGASNRIESGNKSGDFLSQIFPGGKTQGIAGLATMGAGQLMAPKVEIPDIGQMPNMQALRNMNFRNFQEMDPALQDAINRDFDMIDARERERLIGTYKSLRPGADYESDSSFRRDIQELERNQALRRSDALAKYRMEFIANQLQMSRLELEQLTILANADIATIAAQLNIDAQAAAEFKEAFGTAGGMMLQGGLGINQEEPVTADAS